MANVSLENLTRQITTAQKIIIAFGPNALLDHVTAGLALAQLLKQQNKQVSLLGKVGNFDFPIPTIEQISPEAQGRDLVISWPDPHNSVSQIMTESQTDRGRFALVIETKPEGQPIDVSQLEFTYSRVDADLILLMGASVENISSSDVSQLIKQRPQICFRLSTTENLLPQPNIQDVHVSDAPSLSFLIWQISQSLNLKLNPSIATLLLMGLEHRTERFANPDLSPHVFIMIAQCLQSGGVRNFRKSAQNNPPKPSPEISQVSKLKSPNWINPPKSTDSHLPTSQTPGTIQKV